MEVKPLRPACGCIALLAEVYSTRELVELKVATMAKTLDLSTKSPTKERTQERTLCPDELLLLLYVSWSSSPTLGGKGYHIATKEEAGCTIKVKSMDSVHGRDGVTKAGVLLLDPC